jgi:hypothetical protein
MPITTFDPNSGMREDRTEQELEAERMREFLFRKQLADRQQANLEAARSSYERMAAGGGRGSEPMGGGSAMAEAEPMPVGGGAPEASAADRVRQRILQEAGLIPGGAKSREQQLADQRRSIVGMSRMQEQIAGSLKNPDGTPVSPERVAQFNDRMGATIGSAKRAYFDSEVYLPQDKAPLDPALVKDTVRSTLGLKPDTAAAEQAKWQRDRDAKLEDVKAAMAIKQSEGTAAKQAAFFQAAAQSPDPQTRAIGMQGLAKLAQVEVPDSFGMPGPQDQREGRINAAKTSSSAAVAQIAPAVEGLVNFVADQNFSFSDADKARIQNAWPDVVQALAETGLDEAQMEEAKAAVRLKLKQAGRQATFAGIGLPGSSARSASFFDRLP